MSYKSSYKLFATSLLLGAIFFSTQGFADGNTLLQDEAVEADKISIFIPKGSQTGTARVSGCRLCPLQLSIDGGTAFYYQGKPASPRRVTFLSGKSGTVLFDKEQQRVLKIRW